jgi:two-component system, NarL family, response regulator YdfI
MIRVLIAAPSAVVRAGLETLVASAEGLTVAGSFPDLAAVDSLRPDVVLAALPPGEIAAARDGAATAYVLLSGAADPAWTAEALRAGVKAILPSDVSPAAILAAVELAANGLASIDPRQLEELLAAAGPQRAASPADSDLTARERQVLILLAEGAANKTIAWKLDISEHTVKFHVASILAKLHAGTRTEAVSIGIRKGIVLL